MLAALRSLFAVFFAVCVVSTALADKRVALIVANSAYKGAPLDNPIVDADLVAASLRNIGFAVQVVKNADLGGFDGAVNVFADQAKGADVALFYFAGHGFTVNEGIRPVSVLMSTSADVASSSERVLRSGGIPLDEIVTSLTGGAKATLIFVDACRNDPRLSRAIGGKGRGFDRLDIERGGSLFIGLSTRLGDTAEDGEAGKGSPFARAFAANIQVKGMRIDDAFRQVRDAVKSETGGKQLPDVVKDDLPNGAITLVSAQQEQVLSVEGSGKTGDRPDTKADLPYFVDPSVSDGYLGLRAGPGVSHDLLAKIPGGSGDVVVSSCVKPDDGKTTTPFCKAKWAGIEGWVSSCCVVHPGAAYAVDASISDGFLSLRAGPGVGHELLAKIPAGSSDVALFGCVAPDDGKGTRPFCKARWGGIEGWVSSCCISLAVIRSN
jgi:uncharacterized protein YraI